ncbi:unnamed protein product [Choristocarpus tenellus]
MCCDRFISSPGTGLADQSSVSVDGAVPKPVSVSLVSNLTEDNRLYGLGEVLSLTLEFDKRVIVWGTPVLTLDLMESREALYVAGNGSANLMFEYEVSLGCHRSCE